MKMKITKRRKWQRLLAAVVLLLAVGIQAKADVHFVAVDAGYDANDGWWVEVKNTGTDKATSEGFNDGDYAPNSKLGIYFGIATVKDAVSYIEPAGTWNDEETWSIDAGGTKTFYANGSPSNQKTIDFTELSSNTEYWMTIIINQNNYKSLGETKAYVQIKVNSNNTIEILSKEGFTQEVTGSELSPGKVHHLIQGDPYTYKNAEFVRFWGDAKGSNGSKIYSFGWFDIDGKFRGITGDYLITAPQDDFGGCYFDVEPLADNSASDAKDKYTHYEYIDGQPTGNGAVYIGGSKDGFGIPAPNNKYGWDADNTDNRNYEIKNGGAIPQIKAGKYQFELSIGTQINSWGKSGQPLLFKLYHYKVWQPDGQTTFEFKHETFKHETATGKFTYNGTEYTQTTYYIDSESPLSDVFEITNSSDAALGNGNIHGKSVGQDSDIPNFPNGYSFTFTLDATADAVNVPLKVELTHRPVDYIGNGYYKDGFDTEQETKITEVKVNLSATYGGDTTKRIYLRDALRLDWNIPYINTDPNDKDNCVEIETLCVKGELDNNDLYYLGDLVKAGKITNIDLSEATINGNQIPSGFTGQNNILKSIILPQAATNIGSEAFTDCTQLETVTFNSDDKVLIGAAAFKGCTGLSNEKIQDIVNHAKAFILPETFSGTKAQDITIPSDINSIGSKAFANTELEKLTVPYEYKGTNAQLDEYQNYVWPGGAGEAFSKDDSAQETILEKRTLTAEENTSITLQAEDFNKGNGLGYNNNGDTGNQNSQDAHDLTYRSDISNQSGFAIINNNDNDGNIKIGYMKNGYWFKYTFRVTKESDYNIAAYIVNGNADTQTVGFSIDEGVIFQKEISHNSTEWDPWSHEVNIAKVTLKPGIHYITYYAAVDCDLDKIVISEGSDLTEIITPGYNSGEVFTEYKISDQTNGEEQKIMKSASDAFEGVNPNDCEVVFKPKTTETAFPDQMIQGYRNTVDNPGIMSLLTKTMNEDNAYDVVYQEHADAEVKRTFATKKWTSVIFPIDITGKALKNVVVVNDGNNTTAFDKAACLYDNKFNVSGYENLKMRFVYLDNQNTLQEDGQETIKAGTPFLLYVNESTPNDAATYLFKDVTTYASGEQKGSGYPSEKVVSIHDPAKKAGVNNWNFTGRLFWNGSDAISEKIYWVANNEYRYGTNVTMKNFRSWFEAKNEQGAKEIAAIFGFLDEETTGIKIINADTKADDNIYNIQGQIVKKNTTSTVGLPKGIYIVNGNRVIVK